MCLSAMTGNVFTADNPVADAHEGSAEELDPEVDGDSVRDYCDFAQQPTTELTDVRDHRVYHGQSPTEGMGARFGEGHSARKRTSSRCISSIRRATFGEAGI